MEFCFSYVVLFQLLDFIAGLLHLIDQLSQGLREGLGGQGVVL